MGNGSEAVVVVAFVGQCHCSQASEGKEGLEGMHVDDSWKSGAGRLVDPNNNR